MAPPTIPHTVFLDCDDTLYQNQWATAEKITKSIAACTAKLGVSPEKAYELYKTHGTCLKGLLKEGLLEKEKGVDEFLHQAHQIDYSDIAPDPELAAILKRITKPRIWVFTASTREHALRCMERLGLADLPIQGIIDTRTCDLETKHSPHSFEAAMRAAGVDDAAGCLLCDDSVKNIEAAKRMGWRTVLVGNVDRESREQVVTPAAADVHIASLHSLPAEMPELFD
eukprot:CAMPEP_0182814756 /NCGR_PEP_ID=MMETSP0006_2-20121128/10025_1 /TAXON_ID=97485 /ORGANISM="Prymnesium parvum, Strain Texoma1" /LENGTH=225 /DNA_ID=CAMNT_0024940905 /DNA_START=214 /DNA_END=891 /DNA_ORIENTATION=+